jgi:hypothetical protein
VQRLDTHHGLFATGILGVASNQYPCSKTMMRFFTASYRFYCGIDIHASTLALCILAASGDEPGTNWERLGG